MRAFHGDLKIKQKYLDRVNHHIAADHLIRGKGWDGEKGCAVGCTLECYYHKAFEEKLGIPEWLACVEDALFENMTLEKSRTWPRDFLAAIEPGADLEQVKTLYLIYVVKSTLKNFDHKRFPIAFESINHVIDLLSGDPARIPSTTVNDLYERLSKTQATSPAYNAILSCRAAIHAVLPNVSSVVYPLWVARSIASAAAVDAYVASAAYDNYADELIRLFKTLK